MNVRETLLRSLSPEVVAAFEQLVTETVRAELASQATSTSDSPYLTVAEAADYLRASKQRVYDLLSSSRLRRHRDGRRVLVARSELEAHVGGNERFPCQPRGRGVSSRVTTSMPRQRWRAPGPDTGG